MTQVCPGIACQERRLEEENARIPDRRAAAEVRKQELADKRLEAEHEERTEEKRPAEYGGAGAHRFHRGATARFWNRGPARRSTNRGVTLGYRSRWPSNPHERGGGAPEGHRSPNMAREPPAGIPYDPTHHHPAPVSYR